MQLGDQPSKSVHINQHSPGSQNLHLASWRPKRTAGVSSGPNTRRLETQEELMFQLNTEKEKIDVPLQGSQGGGVLPYWWEGLLFVLFRP